MNELNLNNENCTKCEALSKCRKQVVNGAGPLDAKIVIVGEAPGPDEDYQGAPFVGRAGQTLSRLLAEGGIDRSQVRIINAVRCFPKNEDRTVNASFRAPTFEEITACRDYLKQEIEAIKPNVIVPVGSVALSAIMGSKSAAASTKITKVRGTEFWSEEFNCKIMPTFHPSAVMRDPNREPIVIQDFVRIRESSQYRELSKGDEGNYIILDTIEKVDAFFERIKEVPEFVFDLETNSLNWQEGLILEVAFSWKEKTAVVLPITKYIGVPYQEIEIKKRKSKKKVDGKVQVVEVEKQVMVEKVRDTYETAWGDKQEYVLGKLKELMESDKPRIAHNAKFDNKWFMQLGWNPSPVTFDTMLAAHLINENNKGGLGLKDLALNFTMLGDYSRPLENWFKERRISEDNRNYAHVPEEVRLKYAAMDADATFRLLNIFRTKLQEENLVDIFNRLIIPLNTTLTEAEFRGVKIDRECLSKLKQELETDISALEARIKAVTGEINLNSPDQLKQLLFKDLKLPKIKKTKKGEDSTDVEVLTILADMHPIPQLILDYRKMEKLYNTYVVGIEEVLDKDGYLHGSFNITGTECVTKDTFVWSENGLMQIKDIIDQFPKAKEFKDYKIGLVNRFGEIENTSHLYNGGKRKTIKIKTSLGLQLKTTPEHPLLVLRDNELRWIEVKNIHKGDFIETKIGANIWGTHAKLKPSNYIKQTSAKKIILPELITPELSRLVGYWIAEGCYIHTKNQGRFGIRFSNKDPNVLSDMISLIKQIFHISPYVYKDKRTNASSIEVVSREIYEWWIANFGYQHGAKNKYVPFIIKSTSWNNIAEFLRGLTTDACVGLYKSGKKGSSAPFFKLSMDSEQLIQEVQQILLNAGFRAKFYKAKKYKPNIKKTIIGEYFGKYHYQVILDGTEVLRFIEKCPLIVTIHKERMKNFKRQKYSEFKLLKTNKFIRFFEGKWFVSVNKKIPYIEQNVYDFTLPTTHSFVSNGLVSHNSGRLSSSSPNLQNIPKKDKRIKKMFRAEEGNVMVEGDLSMAEIRFWAEFSRDPQLLQDLYDGLDMHREVAARIFKISPDQITDDQRTFAKRTAFGLLYGMSNDKFAKQNKCSLTDAEAGRQAFFGRYPIAKQWLYHISREARMNQYVTNLFGRRRHLPGINSQDEMVKYEAEAASRNSPIQGTASDYACNAANRIVQKFKELGLQGKLRILVHDAIIMDIPKVEFEQSINIMREEMQRPVCNMVVPMVADFSTGENWGTMTKYEFKKETVTI